MSSWDTVIVALIAAGGPLIAQFINSRRQAAIELANRTLQLELDHVADKRALRDQKMQRLREVLAPIYSSVMCLRDAAKGYREDLPGDSESSWDEIVSAAQSKQGEYRVMLALVPSHFDLAGVYESLCAEVAAIRKYAHESIYHNQEVLQGLYERVMDDVSRFEQEVVNEVKELELSISADHLASQSKEEH